MLETRDLYNDYITAVESKIATVAIKIGQYKGSQEYLRNCIINNRAEFEKLNVSVENLLSNPFIAYAKIKPLVDNGQFTRVAHYVKSYVLSLNYLTLHKKLHERLSKAIMPYEVYLKIIGYTNIEIAIHLLKGGYYSFGQAGRMYILEKPRLFFFMGKMVKLPVDWGLSVRHKKQLLQEGKVPYNSRTAPDGIKWHSYHDSDFGYWFWWEAGAIKYRGFMKFIPSNFRTRGENKKKFTSEDEILNTTIIGNVNKMVELMKINPLQYLFYSRTEWINKYEIRMHRHELNTVNT